jgi:methionyl-tRNA synthetase
MADYEVPALADEIGIEQLDPIDLRVGKITACEFVENADKLLNLTVDLGPLGTRTILSGLRKSYEPDDLVGKHVAVFANLKPRKMRGIESQGMVLAAGSEDENILVVELHRSSVPGERIT